MLKLLTYLVFCLFVSFSLQSQSDLSLTISYSNEKHKALIIKSTDSIFLFKELAKHIFEIEANGYITTQIISKKWENKNLYIKINKGFLFEFNEVNFNETLNEFYNGVSFTPEFNPSNITKEFNKVLTYCENNGYPFASIQFSDIKIIKNKVDVTASLFLNDYFIIDSVLIKGDVKTNRFVVYREIGIYPGDIYNESEINKIRNRLNNSQFLSYIRYSEISFSKEKALLTVFINDKSSNKFGGIVGVNSDDKTGKIILSGDVDLKLNNALKIGDRFVLNWRKTRQNTQNFLLHSAFPYLFKSRFGVNAEMTNLRRDTTFSNTTSKFGISYQVQNNQYISVFVKNNQSNSLLQSFNNQMPDFNSTKTIYYGMEFGFNTFDYTLNPTKGYLFNGSISTGTKTINKSSDLLIVEYNNIKDKSTQYEITVVGQKFFPLFKNNTILLKVQVGQLFNDNIFDNELYQIGGLNSLRGFNEQSIVASNYLIGTFEYRILFDKNSSFFTFLDYAYYEQRTKVFNYDMPYGFGTGVNLAVNSGIFTISYALGSEQNNPILFRNSKVHFGFVSVF